MLQNCVQFLCLPPANMGQHFYSFAYMQESSGIIINSFWWVESELGNEMCIENP